MNLLIKREIRSRKIVEKILKFIIFKIHEKEKGIQVKYDYETLWMTQKAMAGLFECSTDNISLHLKNIFKDNELDKNLVIEEFSATASAGKKYQMKFKY